MVDCSKFQELVELARIEAKQTPLDMAIAKHAFDAIAAATKKLRDPFDLWTAIDEQIGQAEVPALQNVLIELRTYYLAAMKAALIDDVEQAFKQSEDDGWIKWMETLAKAISVFRFRFAIGFCKAPFLLPDPKKREAENIREAVSCMSQARWPEAYETLGFIAKQEFLPEAIRAHLYVMCGQI